MKQRRILFLVSVLYIINNVSGAKIPSDEQINEIEEEEIIVAKSNNNNNWSKFGSDFMYGLLKLSLKAGLVTEEDLKVHFLPKEGQRQARNDK